MTLYTNKMVLTFCMYNINSTEIKVFMFYIYMYMSRNSASLKMVAQYHFGIV